MHPQWNGEQAWTCPDCGAQLIPSAETLARLAAREAAAAPMTLGGPR